MFLDRVLEKLDNWFYEFERGIRNRMEQLAIALAMIFPSDGW